MKYLPFTEQPYYYRTYVMKWPRGITREGMIFLEEQVGWFELVKKKRDFFEIYLEQQPGKF